MITFAICLIYYGIAVWLYQVHLWISSGHWVPIPVMVAWRVAFGVPATDQSVFGYMTRWVLDLPLSLALLAVGLGILGTIAGLRRAGKARRQQMRRKWIAEQCEQAGYTPWTVPKVLADLEAPPPLDHGGGKQGFG